MKEIRKEIESMEEAVDRLLTLANDNNAIKKNAEIIKTFIYILKFITPVEE